MTVGPKIALRLHFLVRVLRKDLDRAEQLGLLESADEWMTMRKLRNQMVHEYVEDPAVLINAL